MSISAHKRLRVFARDGYKCRYCEKNSDLTIDHIVPLSKGGGENESNLQTLCFSCNTAKSSSPNEQFVPKVAGNRLPKISLLNMVIDYLGKFFVTKNDLRQSHDTIVKEFQSLLDRTFDAKINPVKEASLRHLKDILDQRERTIQVRLTGVDNTLEAYHLRSKERDIHLLKFCKALAEYLEE